MSQNLKSQQALTMKLLQKFKAAEPPSVLIRGGYCENREKNREKLQLMNRKRFQSRVN
jgi:hypothetical protein